MTVTSSRKIANGIALLLFTSRHGYSSQLVSCIREPARNSSAALAHFPETATFNSVLPFTSMIPGSAYVYDPVAEERAGSACISFLGGEVQSGAVVLALEHVGIGDDSEENTVSRLIPVPVHFYREVKGRSEPCVDDYLRNIVVPTLDCSHKRVEAKATCQTKIRQPRKKTHRTINTRLFLAA